LLKSQYNHINHLDEKLNEVTLGVASLKGEFNDLKGEFSALKGELNVLKVSIEHTIQKSLNRNMVMLFGMMVFF